jgi:hypothetical protein
MHLINDFQVARWKEKLFFAHLNAVDDPQFPMWGSSCMAKMELFQPARPHLKWLFFMKMLESD